MKVSADIDWEVLIVNNNCTDDTEQVVEGFADTLPIRSLTEKQQGLSHARNRAVQSARGEYIIWTDDDVVVSVRWLDAYVRSFLKWKDDVVFGGPILPQFEGEPPAWLVIAMGESNIEHVFALRDLGSEPVALELNGQKIPYGANFAVRTKEQREFLYNPILGPNKSNNVRGDETELISRILSSGESGRWVPDASVQHFISRRRQTVAFLREYFVGQGRTEIRRHPTQPVPSFLGIPRWLWKAAIVSQLRYRSARLFSSPEIWCRELGKAYVYLGKCLEHRDMSRRGSLS